MKKYIMVFIFFSFFGFGFLFAQNEISQLRATIVGSGSPMYNKNRAGPSVLISQGNTSILVDMGNGTQGNLNKLGINIRKISALLFTHHHLDHNEEFVPILIRSILGRNNFTIAGPPNTVKFTNTNLELYEEDISYRLSKSNRTYQDRKNAFKLNDIKGGESFSIDDIKVSSLKVPHSIYALAYRFEYENESIVVTGDLTYSKELASFAKDAAFMIIDSGGMVMKNSRRPKNTNRDKNRLDRGNINDHKKARNQKQSSKKAHLNLNQSSLIAKDANVKNLVYTHFRAGQIDKAESLKLIRENYKGNVIFGKDLMLLKK